MSINPEKQNSNPTWNSSGQVPASKLLVWIGILIAFVLGFLDLTGWIFNITLFKSIMPNWEPMRIITAASFVFASLSLIIPQMNLPIFLRRTLPGILAGILGLISLITIYVYIYSVSTGLESSLTELSYFASFTASGTRMAFLTAFNFFLIGGILFLLMTNNKIASAIAHVLIVPVAFVTYIVIISYVLGVYSMNDILEVPVALNTAFAFCGLCVSVLAMRRDTWLLKVFTSQDMGGIFARRLLPWLMVLPVLIGWFRIRGEYSGIFKSEEGVVLVAATYTVCFIVLIIMTAKSVNRIDKKRRVSEEALLQSEEKFRLIATNTPDHVLIQDTDLRYRFVLNPQLGLTEVDMIGKTDFELISEIEARHISEIKNRVLRTGKPEYVNIPLVNAKGETEYFEGVYLSKHNRDSEIDGIIGYIRNVTEKRRMENALIESEEQYRLLFEGMSEGFAVHEIILDEKGEPCNYRFLSINPSFEKQTGLKAGNVIGRTVTEVLPETEKFWIETYGKVALTGESIEFENYLSELNSYFRVSAFSPKKGYFAVIFENITVRILAENELKRTKNYLENLIDFANVPIIVWNSDTEIELFNHAFEHLTGYTSAEVKGKKLELLFPKNSLKKAYAKIKESLTQNWDSIEIPILAKNRQIKSVLWNSANIYDSDNRTLLSTIAQGNDITKRKRAEQKVKERTRELELANARLNQELNDRIIAEEALQKSEEKLKELNATKDKFFNIVSHDLKNPFTSLIGASELLYQNINKMDNEQIKALALILNDTSKSGYSILQNLLDWSRSQAGLLKINPEKINLRELIDEHIFNLDRISANKDIKILSKIKKDIFVIADKNMLKTIFRNLLSNAIKYSYRNGKVVVDAVTMDGKLIITVKDHGIGIPEENIEKIFRIDAKYSIPGTENEQGTGLGLKLCKEFVEKQNGIIWVESIENQGSEFKFSIPYGLPETAP
jgi:PAS domain S-box-containing protein